MEQLLKQLAPGSVIHALFKSDKLTYAEGTVNTAGAPRREMPKYDASNPMAALASPKEVMDLTFTFNGATFTETVDPNQVMFGTNKMGVIALVATSVEPIVRELRATKKQKEDYLKETETGIPKAKESIEECDKLIGELDTSYAEKQAMNERINNLEAQNAETNKLLRELINKLGK
jgi:hypothetical protein